MFAPSRSLGQNTVDTIPVEKTLTLGKHTSRYPLPPSLSRFLRIISHVRCERARESINLAGNKRRSFSSQGGLLNRMFGSNGKDDESAIDSGASTETPKVPQADDAANVADKTRAGSVASTAGTQERKPSNEAIPIGEKKRRSSGVSRARDMFSSAKQSLHLAGSSPTSSSGSTTTASPDKQPAQTPMQKLGKADPALSVPQGSLNNSAGESHPGPRSTFRVGVTEDKNKKCRRTMEDTHAYLYNFLSTPAPLYGPDKTRSSVSDTSIISNQSIVETDNGYFAIFDGHAGTFAADWCGKKLHLLLEDTIRKNPNTPVPELLDQTFTQVDQQLEKLPLKNSGCTAVTAVLRWEDRVPNAQSSTGSVLFAPAAVSAVKHATESGDKQIESIDPLKTEVQATEARVRNEASRQRVLYTANVGDARIVLCRNGRALRLSYDHKGSDENEGRRVAGAGGLILNNRVNGVLAVTRALGDAYMKDLVTGHPYTTETVIQPDQDEFLILACDGVRILSFEGYTILTIYSSGMYARIRKRLIW
jgi:protein phosphatase PTC1